MKNKSTSGIYLRIIDDDNITLRAGKCYRFYGTMRQNTFDEVLKYDKTKVRNDVCIFNYPEIKYPVRIQAIKKIKYRNGNVTKKVLFEKIVF